MSTLDPVASAGEDVNEFTTVNTSQLTGLLFSSHHIDDPMFVVSQSLAGIRLRCPSTKEPLGGNGGRYSPEAHTRPQGHAPQEEFQPRAHSICHTMGRPPRDPGSEDQRQAKQLPSRVASLSSPLRSASLLLVGFPPWIQLSVVAFVQKALTKDVATFCV